MKNKMTTQTNNNSKQQGKKFIVYLVMVLGFCVAMWYIFTPTDAEKKEEVHGVNTTLPDPKRDVIIGNKKEAYEQAQLREKKQEQMQSLENYQHILTEEKDSTILRESPKQAGDTPSKQPNSIKGSTNAYHDLNRTIGTFYDPPKEDKEKEELRKKVEELQRSVDGERSRQSSIDEQVALMEKSYELAARHLPKSQTSAEGEIGNDDKIKVSPIVQVHNETISMLSQPMSNVEFTEYYSKPRNMGFNSGIISTREQNKNTISVVVHGTQTIADGQSIRLRLTEAILAGETYIPVNTILTGMCKIQGERLEILISSLEYAGKLIVVEMTVYDSDGQKGVFIPGSMEMNAIKEVAANMGGNLGSSINITQQRAGEQLLTDLGRGVIQGTSQYISKKVSQIKVTLKAGHKLLLLPKENQ